MKATAVFLSLIFALAPMSAMELRSDGVTLSSDDQAACEAGGGCVFATREKIMEAVEAAAKRRAGNCMGSARLEVPIGAAQWDEISTSPHVAH